MKLKRNKIIVVALVILHFACSHDTEDQKILFPGKDFALGLKLDNVKKMVNGKLEEFDNPNKNRATTYFQFIDTIDKEKMTARNFLIFNHGRLVSFRSEIFGENQSDSIRSFYFRHFKENMVVHNNDTIFTNVKPNVVETLSISNGQSPKRYIYIYKIEDANFKKADANN